MTLHLRFLALVACTAFTLTCTANRETLTATGHAKLGDGVLWPSKSDGPYHSARSVARAFTQRVLRERPVYVQPDQVGVPSDPTWVTVRTSPGAAIVRLLAVPRADGNWSLIQAGQADVSLRPGGTAVFARAIADGGEILFRSRSRTKRIRLDARVAASGTAVLPDHVTGAILLILRYKGQIAAVEGSHAA